MGLFDKIKQAFNPQKEPDVPSEFDRVIHDTVTEYSKAHDYFWSPEVSTTSVWTDSVKPWPNKKKTAFILYCVAGIERIMREKSSWSSSDPDVLHSNTMMAYLQALMRNTLVMDDDDALAIYTAFRDHRSSSWRDITQWPISLMVNQLMKQRKGQAISPAIQQMLEELVSLIKAIPDAYYRKERLKLSERIENFLYSNDPANQTPKPVTFLEEDRLAAYANPMIMAMPTDEQRYWYALLTLAQKATGGKPSDKYVKEGKKHLEAMGVEKFAHTMHNWMVFLATLKDEEQHHTHTYANGTTYNYTSIDYISAVNAETMKGLIWLTAHLHDGNTIRLLSTLAERCYKKIPGKGPTAASLGNACLYALYRSEGLEGIGQLSRLKLRVKQSSTEALIDKYLAAAAEERGVSKDDIEDMSVDDHGLANSYLLLAISTYTAELSIEKVGKVNLRWFKADGSEQKSVPTVVKEQHANVYKQLKDTVKQIEQTLTAQRDRIDRMFRDERLMPVEHFEQYYWNHGLMGWLSRRIIWRFHKENGVIITALWIQKDDEPKPSAPQPPASNLGEWVDSQGNQVDIAGSTHVSLWHPVLASLEEVRQWRALLMREQFLQPLKQAYREIYILTDAELNTKTYSNRMAAHLLKQHQFNSLAKTRGWRYALLGAFDNGVDFGRCILSLPKAGLRAEYWINEVNVDNGWNDTGIYLYVSTDQVRFYRDGSDDPMPLEEVPVLVFSEVMRDVDLFVGVASVGNDPNWQDGGALRSYQLYWEGYSFGELGEVAKNRREILQGLVPRLKIAPVAEIGDRFLVVRGKLRTYKIHLGSTNILMEPNDQYLCIVPDRSAKDPASNLFLPFEGDNGLSIILSKAFLLAEDDKITDETITRQIGR
jgi:hypothetical protein